MVFVLGTGRCGSTLLHELLARHPHTGFVTNLDDRGLWLSTRQQVRAWRRLPPQITQKGRTRFAPSEGYRALAREVSPMVVDPAHDLIAEDISPWLINRLRRFVTIRQEKLGFPVFLHKFTGWPRIALLEAAFPDAFYVHVVRDGRAVANSWLQMPWWKGHLGPSQWHFGPLEADDDQRWRDHGATQPGLAAIAWDLLTAAHDRAEEELGGRWLTVRHEDLVSAPDDEHAKVLHHLGLPADAQFTQALSRQGLTGTRTAAFRRDLSPAQLRTIEALIADRLEHYGYEV